jgi:NAD-dependent deacetylase
LVQQADVFIVVGTSLQVYPAASLVEFVPTTSPKFLIDPGKPESQLIRELSHIAKGAGEGLDLLYPQLLQLSK